MPLPSDQTPTPQEAMAAEALSAIHNGERARARDLLTRLLKEEQENADYWVWMSAVVDTPRERVFCLNEALRIDPQSEAARRGMLIAGSLPIQEDLVVPARLQKRDWQAKIVQQERVVKKTPPVYMVVLLGIALVIVVGLLGLAFFGEQLRFPKKRRLVIIYPTETRVTGTALMVTQTPAPPASGSPTPLWLMLESTYTPTPLYVRTPHMSSESFGLGMRALQRDDWTAAEGYFWVAATDIAVTHPDAPDVLYYIGENYRLQEKMSRALEMFNLVIEQSPDFAPAYLGRARVRLADGSKAMVAAAMSDLLAAVEKDPEYGEAYLALASLQVTAGQARDALETLDQALPVLPDSALVHLYRAQAFLALGEAPQALASARRANELDVTLLLAYKIIGQALQAEGDLESSLAPLTVYVQNAPDDAQGWKSLADAHLARKDTPQALQELDRALELDNQLGDAYLARAGIYLEMGRYADALDDYEAAARFDPASFQASIGIGKALMGLNDPGDAWDRFERTRGLAETDLQKAELIFWRGQSLEALGELQAAARDYQALVDLPSDQVERDWVSLAKSRLAAWATQTPTPTPTARP